MGDFLKLLFYTFIETYDFSNDQVRSDKFIILKIYEFIEY